MAKKRKLPKLTLLSTALTGSMLYSIMPMATAADDAATTPNATAATPAQAAAPAPAGAASAPAATPKPTEANKLEAVVVTGYRASIMKALDNKLAADAIMESIVAEDIGKLPEQNIAEAISRVPGVTVTRKQGEGQQVSLRGLDPSFNTALLNGRILATENQGRAYNFDILPAELISGVDIYKTPTASQLDGGIGGTTNMKTAQPLVIGNKVAFSGQGNYDQQRGKVSPQSSGLVSVKSADGTLGGLVAFSYLDRKIEGRRIFTDGFVANQSLCPGARDPVADGHPCLVAPITGASVPTWTEYDINDTHRKRVSAMATLQWRPSDALTVTADALHSKLDVNDNSKIFYAGSDASLITNAVVDANKTATSYTGGWGEGVVSFSRPRLAETNAVGLNLKWKTTQALTSEFDVATSKATDRNGGNQNWFDVNLNAPGFNAAQLQYNLGPNNLPTYSNLGNIYDTSHATVNGLVWEGQSIEDKVRQATYTGKYKLPDGAFKSLTSFDFGLNYSDRQKTQSVYTTPGLWGLYAGVAVPQSLFSTAANSVNFMGSGMFNAPFPTFDAAALQSYLLTDAVINQTSDPAATRDYIAKHGNGFGVELVPGSSGSVREKTTGGFVQANFAGDWGERSWSANVGLRYVSTNVSSTGVAQEILRIDPPPTATGERVIVLSPPVPVTLQGSYREWLPSANFKVDVSDSLMFQTSVAKTMTRANLTDLLLARNIDARYAERQITEGNPGLKPMIAWNYDMSLTWYDGKGSSLSGAIFSKNITNLAQRQTSTTTVVGESFLLSRPENVGKRSLSGIELGGQYLFNKLPAPFNGLGVLGNFTYVGQANTKTYNLGGFYEKGPIEFRVAYNYRNAYRDSESANRGQPLDIAAYGEVEASLNYAITKKLTVFAQGINLNNAKIHSYSIYPQRLVNYEAYGPRYALGARVSL